MKPKKQPIILCAGKNGRAVLFGYVDSEPVPGEPVALYDARMVIMWTGEEGCLGLAANGPQNRSRLSPTVSKTVETVWQEWIAATDKAAEAFRE